MRFCPTTYTDTQAHTCSQSILGECKGERDRARDTHTYTEKLLRRLHLFWDFAFIQSNFVNCVCDALISGFWNLLVFCLYSQSYLMKTFRT